MASITAKGNTEFGYQQIQITGENRVERILCSDGAFRRFVEVCIEEAQGRMANSYKPSAGTMLQALALLSMIYDYRDVIVEGNIGTIPQQAEVIY